MANNQRGFGVTPTREAFCWGPSLPAAARITVAAATASGLAWERPMCTTRIQLDSQSCVAISAIGDELSQEDALRLLEQAADQLRASLKPRLRVAA